MKIEMILYASLGKMAPDKMAGTPFQLELDEGALVRHAVKKLNIPDTFPLIIFVNGRHSRLDGILNEGDRLALFPPIAGG